ncbi:MAG: hypothetical protein QGI45_10435, partial [Myxococcota bacterium]|nr:hypothetical protein [Myxococcota bacterium]
DTCDDDISNDCTQDCAGTWGGSAYVDNCDTCDDDISNDCTQDCAGTWGGSAYVDNCDICDDDATNDCEEDCAGAWGGDAYEDACGSCDDDPSNDCVMQTLHLHAGFNRISFTLTPEDNQVELVFAELIADGNLIMVSGEEGFFQPDLPPFLITLTHVEPGVAYWVQVIEPGQMSVYGAPLSADFSVDLNAGQNHIGYWLSESMPPEEAFQALIAQNILVSVTGLDVSGGPIIYDPKSMPFLNTLTTMEPGQGYVVTVSVGVEDFDYGEVLVETDSQVIELSPGWNQISLTVLPADNTVEVIFAEVINAGHLIMISGAEGFFDADGLPFLNTLTHIESGLGYLVQVDAAVQMTVVGAPLSADFSVDLNAGANHVGYWLNEPMTPVEAFAELAAANNLILVTGFDDAGGSVFFDPAGLPFLNTLTELIPGQGYVLSVNYSVDDFRYPDILDSSENDAETALGNN